ncbi:MAG: hypothetical protein L0Y36_05545 [Planctomycetales bacterium]|nr:hypothetical protein [Planctomycetales bacterium]
MKTQYVVLSVVIAGLTALAVLNGCKKEPAAPAVDMSHEAAEAAESTKEPVTQTAETIEQTTCPIMDGNKINKDIFSNTKARRSISAARPVLNNSIKTPRNIFPNFRSFKIN